MSMIKIETITVGAGGAAAINFTSIPQVYQDLYVVLSLRTALTGGADVYAQFNGDTSNTYSMRRLYGTGSATASDAVSSTATGLRIGRATPSDFTANVFASSSAYIPNYTAAAAKTVSIDSVDENNASNAISMIVAGSWSGTAAITSMIVKEFTGANLLEGSTATLYGINRKPVASLGATPTVDYLVVAGGGGGGSTSGGGGGGGGFRSSVPGYVSGGGATAETKVSVTAGSAITVTVGAGGAGGSNDSSTTYGTTGSSSTFSTITATGGGGGGKYDGTGLTGGSGGGSGSTTGGSAISGQGYAGGSGNGGLQGGGGGGAGAVGANYSTGQGGNGGNGAATAINGSSVIFGGGGGGGSHGSGTPGVGGQGGGGTASPYGVMGVYGSPGLVNTGGGGGAGSGQSGVGYAGGGAGGSGIVIIRYPDTYTAPTAVTGSPMVNHINGYRVYTWFNSGSITF